MLCPICGAEVGAQIVICPKCLTEREKKRTDASALEAEEVQVEIDEGTVAYAGYAGFWFRFVAWIIDFAVILFIYKIFSLFVSAVSSGSLTSAILFAAGGDAMSVDSVFAMGLSVLILSMLFYIGVFAVIAWLYYALFESSPRLGTLGKIAVGLAVTDSELRPATFGRVSLRHFAKIISALPLYGGFIFAAFNERKQGLHDLISGCLVLKREEASLQRTLICLVGGIIISNLVNFIPDGTPEPEVAVDIVNGVAVKVNKQDPNVRLSGSVQYGDTLVVPTYSLTFYNPRTKVLDIGLFVRKPDEIKLEDVKKSMDGKMMDSLRPDMEIHLTFSENARFCNKDDVKSFQVEINSRTGGFPLSQTLSAAETFDGITELSCQLREGGVMKLGFKKSVVRETKAGPWNIKWDLDLGDRIIAPSAVEEVEYSSGLAAAQVGIWSKATRELQIGFFDYPVDGPDLAIIRSQGSLLAIKENVPALVLSLLLRPDSKQLSLEQVSSYSVAFYRNSAQGREWPGANAKSTFSYVPRREAAAGIFELKGGLAESQLVTGSLSHSGKKDIDQIVVEFSWDLNFKAKVIDISVDEGSGEAAVVDDGVDIDPSAPGETFAKVSYADNEITFGGALAIFYPKDGDIAVGFYTDPLTDDEIERIRDKRFVWTTVNGKRPNMVHFLDLKRGINRATIDDFLSVETFFYRDKIGAFYFPGGRDRLSFKRDAEQLPEGEMRQLGGDLQEGGTLLLRTKGERESFKAGVKFNWDIRKNIPIIVVR